jgi:hypothetical protein
MIESMKTLFLLTCVLNGIFVRTFGQVPGNGIKGNEPEVIKHKVGDDWGGGRIFWIDDTGDHGLIAAVADQDGQGVAWNPGEGVKTGADKEGVYRGMENSKLINSVQGNGAQYAARMCLDHKKTAGNTTYDDWYLPSKKELSLLYGQKTIIGGFNITNGIYWSSTESSGSPATMAWEQEFRYGSQLEDDKDQPELVRCIRKF